jgi:hypothetical protein
LEQQKIDIDWQAQGFALKYSTTAKVTFSNKGTNLLSITHCNNVLN